MRRPRSTRRAPSACRRPRPSSLRACSRASRRTAGAQECLYPLRLALPPLGRFFAEPAWHARLAELDPEPAAGVTLGLHRGGTDEGGLPRGAFSLYVPERCDGKTPLPFVVALHGGFGHGHDFVWTWLREARCTPFLLLAPSSRGSTWSLDAPAGDVRMLHSLVESVCANWPVDRSRMLLTGLSDGATFTLLAGLAADSPFSHLAPVSGVLHPANFANGNLARARGRRVRLCHGALDWLFPVTLARLAHDELVAGGGGGRVPRDSRPLACVPARENRAILNWLDAHGLRFARSRRALLPARFSCSLASARCAPALGGAAAFRCDRRSGRRAASSNRLSSSSHGPELSNPRGILCAVHARSKVERASERKKIVSAKTPFQRSARTKSGASVPRATSSTAPSSVTSKPSRTTTRSRPPGDRTATGLATSPRRSAAQATAQAEDPDAEVSPAPRSQIRISSACGRCVPRAAHCSASETWDGARGSARARADRHATSGAREVRTPRSAGSRSKRR